VGPGHRRRGGSRSGCRPGRRRAAEVRAEFLRGSRTPDRVVFRDELPTNATGKLLRREIIDSLATPKPKSKGIQHDQKRHSAYRGQVCDTRSSRQGRDSLDDLRCGGHPMVAMDADKSGGAPTRRSPTGNAMGQALRRRDRRPRFW